MKGELRVFYFWGCQWRAREGFKKNPIERICARFLEIPRNEFSSRTGQNF
jgi:hypothetical protein